MFYVYFRGFAWSSNLTLLWTHLFLPYQDLPLGLPLGIKWGKKKLRLHLLRTNYMSGTGWILQNSHQFPPVSTGVLYYPFWRGVLYHPFWSKQMEGIIQDSSFDAHIFPPSQGNYNLKSDPELKAKSQCPPIWVLSSDAPGSQGKSEHVSTCTLFMWLCMA